MVNSAQAAAQVSPHLFYVVMTLLGLLITAIATLSGYLVMILYKKVDALDVKVDKSRSDIIKEFKDTCKENRVQCSTHVLSEIGHAMDQVEKNSKSIGELYSKTNKIKEESAKRENQLIKNGFLKDRRNGNQS